MKSPAWSWRVVLVRPRNPLNIGAAARAMANFGFRELVVVNPYEPTWQETRSAVGAEEVVRSARAVPTLIEAIGDASLVVGTTSGSRRHLTRKLMPLGKLTAWVDNRHPQDLETDPETRSASSSLRQTRGAGRAVLEPKRRALRAALLFGSEKTGLTNKEMTYCHALVHIPTSADCPSMNLGQAVAVCCYELARQVLASRRVPGARIHRSDPATLQSLERIFERVVHVLDEAGYLQPKSRQAAILKLRQFLLEIGLTNYDARILGGVLAQIEWKLGLKSP
jgi:tRNA C32,U32 (ribose-2'-O)-methylase TrmJ